MITTIRRRINIYGAFAAVTPKMFMAYSIWVWMQYIVQIIAIIIMVAFWTAVYANQDTLSGLTQSDTLNYIVLAQIFLPLANTSGTVFYFGTLMREGQMGIELLRPLDFQAATYVRNIAEVGVGVVIQFPLAIVAWLLFHFELPTDPLIWLAFIFSVFLGNAVLFCFDWIIGCVSFYNTETWGLGVMRFSISTFFSGALIPLAMMPGWLQTTAAVLPFSHALYVPVSLLSGITPLSEMPRIWGIQLIYLVLLGFLSRWVFNVSVRKVTVQGG